MASFLTWDPPLAEEHPRIWINDRHGITLANAIANRNAQGTGAGTPWANLVSYEAGHRAHAISYYGLLEYGLSHAAVWLLGEGVISSGERLNAGNRAVTVMLGIVANYTPGISSTGRERMMMLGMMYDWMYDFAGFSAADKATVRTEIVAYVATFLRCGVTEATPHMDDSEFIWGHAHGDACTAIVGLAAILGDGTSAENTRWQGWMDYLLDMQDDGATGRFFPVFRYFARNAADDAYDGGTHKGSGDYSYVTKNEEFHNRMFPMMASALGMTTIWDDEEWYQLWMDWNLWHLRSDFHSHMQGESRQQAYFSHLQECHAIQVAQRNPATALGQACQWYHMTYCKNQVPGGTYSIWGPYYIWVILWRQQSVVQTPPFLAAMNGGWQSKVFENVAKVCCRTGWGARLNATPGHADYNKLDQDYSSVTLCLPRFFLGTHQLRDAGHFDFIVRGKPLLIKTGQYDGEQTLEYKHDAQITTDGRDFDETNYHPFPWSRVGTTITIYKQSHGLAAGGSVTIVDPETTGGSDASATLPAGSRTVQAVTTHTFTVLGNNTGTTAGRCHLTIAGNSSADGPITTDPTGHRKCYTDRVIGHNCVGIHSVLEESMISAGGNYEQAFDDTLNFDTVKAGFAVMNDAGTVKTLLNVGDQIWAKHPATRPITLSEPQDLRDIVGGAKLATFCKEGTFAHFSRGTIGGDTTRQWAYAVGNLGLHYWTGKCTSYLRHFLYLGPGTVPGWNDAILVVWDDITCVPDATYAKKTCTFRLHSPVAYAGSAANIVIANGTVRGYIQTLLPVGVERTDVEGFKIGAHTLFAGETDVIGDFGRRRDGMLDTQPCDFDRTKVPNAGDFRIELNPPTSTADVDFLVVIFGGTVAMGVPPAAELFTDGGDTGVKFNAGTANEITFLFAEAAPLGLTVNADLTPAAPLGLTATVISQTRIGLDWDTSPEDDIAGYLVYRSKWGGTEWGAYGTPVSVGGGPSLYSDTGLDPGATYRYYVTAVDTTDHESPASDVVSATTPATPPVSATGAGSAPWSLGGKYSKYLLDRR